MPPNQRFRWADCSAQDEDDSHASSNDDDDDDGSDLDDFIVPDHESDSGGDGNPVESPGGSKSGEDEEAEEPPRRARALPELDEDDLELALENAGLKNPYEEYERRLKRKRSRRRERNPPRAVHRARKVILSSDSEPEPQEEAAAALSPQEPRFEPKVSVVPLPPPQEPPAGTGSGASFLDCDSFYSSRGFDWVVDEGEDDYLQGSWSQRPALQPKPKPKSPVLASIFQRQSAVQDKLPGSTKWESSDTQMHRRHDGSVFFARADGTKEERGHMT